jgi:hypothetical protein
MATQLARSEPPAVSSDSRQSLMLPFVMVGELGWPLRLDLIAVVPSNRESIILIREKSNEIDAELIATDGAEEATPTRERSAEFVGRAGPAAPTGKFTT